MELVFLTQKSGKVLNDKDEVIGSFSYDRRQEKYIADVTLPSGERKRFYNSDTSLLHNAIYKTFNQ